MQWQIQEAKAKFSEMVERALKEGPQTVTGSQRGHREGQFGAKTTGARRFEGRLTSQTSNLVVR